VVVAVVLVPFQVYVLLPWMWNVSYSLPLQLCDLAWITAVYALWTRRRWAHALLYYWGLTLSSQAFITPELAAPDFPSRESLITWPWVAATGRRDVEPPARQPNAA